MSEQAALTEAGKNGLMVTNDMRRRLKRYLEILQEQNTCVNLTRILDSDEIWIKHFYDSWTLAMVPGWDGTGRMADVGSGAGFPGIPLKILYPELNVVLMDSVNKRVDFLRYAIGVLGLERIEAVHGRAEDLARLTLYRESFNWVSARAVAGLSVLAEYCLPFASLGGWFAAYKGPDPQDEMDEARFGIERLGGCLKYCVPCQLPLGYGKRHLIMIQKIRETSGAYPRKSGVPARKPLKF
jgi:16S rRNA (guanine527-N7)-methyltransferase